MGLVDSRSKPTRQPRFQRNADLEALLAELSALLSPVEKVILQRYRMPRYPVTFIVGAPRCGSTLMLQWLADTGQFAYPTNLLSRFYAAPYVGAKIQQLLADPRFNFREELTGPPTRSTFDSDLGKTQGILEPNEFWYFWRRFIPNTDPEYLDAASLARIDTKTFAAELGAIEAVFEKPIAMKAIILEFNVPFLSEMVDKALFLYLSRDPFYQVQSLLEAREKYYGDRTAWYSVKPKEFEKLRELDPFLQVAGQVHYTNEAIEDGLEKIDPKRRLTVTYEEFCADPRRVYEQIGRKLSDQGYSFSSEYHGPSEFECTNQVRVSDSDAKLISEACRIIPTISLDGRSETGDEA